MLFRSRIFRGMWIFPGIRRLLVGGGSASLASSHDLSARCISTSRSGTSAEASVPLVEHHCHLRYVVDAAHSTRKATNDQHATLCRGVIQMIDGDRGLTVTQAFGSYSGYASFISSLKAFPAAPFDPINAFAGSRSLSLYFNPIGSCCHVVPLSFRCSSSRRLTNWTR